MREQSHEPMRTNDLPERFKTASPFDMSRWVDKCGDHRGFPSLDTFKWSRVSASRESKGNYIYRGYSYC